MSSLGLTAEILREALHLEAERPTREQVATLTAVLDRVLSDRRVSIEGDTRAVVVDAMVAAGIGDHAPTEQHTLTGCPDTDLDQAEGRY
jgi:hypothetical protein